MKYTNFKIWALLLSTSALLALSGCDNGSGISYVIGDETPPVVTPPPVIPPPVIPPPVTPPPVVPPETEAECLINAGGYEAIEVGGRTWLDRNMGASEVATDGADTAAFGDLYQWGRGSDGHEDRASALTPGGTGHATTILPNTGEAWDGLFINEGSNGTNIDWTKSNVDSNGSERSALWGAPSSDSNLNQVCPCGYIVPSNLEFTDLNTTELAALKLTISGYRSSTGTIETDNGNYWTRIERPGAAYTISFDGSSAFLSNNERSEGQAIRCIKP